MEELTKAVLVFSDIKEKIINGKLVNRDRLPSVKKLANEFSVSKTTIFKAFELLENENLITRIQKSGVFVGPKNDPIPHIVNPAKTRAEEIADSLISEIIRGDIKTGDHLTLNKVLTFKYATSKKTIKKAIEILIEGNYIHKDGFRYVIGRQTGSSYGRITKNRVYIITKQTPAGWKFLFTSESAFFQSFEHELQKQGVTSLEYLNFWNEQDLVNAVKEPATAGFLIDFSPLEKNEPEKLLTHFNKTLEVIGKKHLPLIVNNYNGILRYFPNFTFKPGPNIFFIGYDDFKAGEKTGNFLASKGHKQIAYFIFGNVPWDTQRFTGVKSEIKRFFGDESDVYPFIEDSDAINWHADLSTYASTPIEEKKKFLEGYRGLFKGYEFQIGDPIEEPYPLLANLIFKDNVRKQMAPFFEKALRIKEVTAWVGTSYLVTITAAEFLKKHKIDVPEKISLLCLGDEDIIMANGITAYDFMQDKGGYLAAHCILGDIPVKKGRKGFMKYEGQVMVRKSVKAV
jgi:DNA-binding transcriptional regulator YhcF (GntR family)/DNA-binding LacI/PurR family transcriptional regulator